MSCVKLAALALRLLDVSTDQVADDPALFIRTECGIEAGVIARDGRLAFDAGFRVPLFRFVWIRAGAERDRVRRVRVIPKGPADQDVKGNPASIFETVERHAKIRPRASIGADLGIGRLFIAPEAEATRGGLFLLSAGIRF